jgi:TrmH family RNA methyltransferase
MTIYISKEHFKKVCRVNNPKYRTDKTSPFDIIVEGERLISQILDYQIGIDALYIHEDKTPAYQHIISRVGCPISLLTTRQSKMLSETQSEQGIFAQIAFCTQPITKYRRLLYLNAVSDPGNLGTIIRSASVFDIDGLIVDEHCCSLANPKLIRASMGAVFTVPIQKVNNVDFDAIGELAGGTLKVIESSPVGGARLSKYDFPQTPFIVLIGSEAHGVSPHISALATDKVSIDIKNQMESLNVAVASSIIMYHIGTSR